ncbi:glycoside hydrolase family 3 protein [Xylona heveae TC161]|uniref:beta-glucosidase n=1 Tax=Xylona heveae (strain CBS 132557 / TC161) TaxID=1328760 RepID=A0A165H6S5_XYLHT|nr:glycoside hydrolase family 3 protein [Xylona heveae TC161]KZF23064.1 glycoside hydrolase family 3 protein [Xylona heveae TC161]
MANLDVYQLLSQLSVEEKISLLAGIDFWHTAPIPRLGIPSIRMSDGPNGIRGTRFFNGVPAACFPCGTALGATWDVGLIEAAGQLMAEEARAKGAAVVLGPTVNMQRSPLGGRGFESFSEDPVLAGSMAAAEIKGMQSRGVASTIKHFVCNDQEDERQAVDSIITERALREIYLLPFQIAMRDAQPRAFMTAYNKVNGTHASEDLKLLQDILRDEWGFHGLTMSDWGGTYSVSEAVNAGLDIEMPGPSVWRGELVKLAWKVNKIKSETIDKRVLAVLDMINYAIEAGITGNAPETTNDTPETAKLLRDIAASSIVLLKNERELLPLKTDKTVAVIGPNAKVATYCGGGSASLRPYYAVTPYEGISRKSQNVEYALGATSHKQLPLLNTALTLSDGQPGFKLRFYTEPPTVPNREVVDENVLDSSFVNLMDYKNPQIRGLLYYVELESTFTPEEDGVYEFGLTVNGTGKLFIDGRIVVDNASQQRTGDSFFGSGTVEEIGSIEMKAGKTYEVGMQFGTSPTQTVVKMGATAMAAGGFRLGGMIKTDPENEIQKAISLAQQVDQVVLCAGLNSDWESEGYDRTHMDLPGNLNALIDAVASANPNTVVVLQSGTPVSMPWASKVPAIIQAWYGGNETGNSIADVLFGTVNPSGKLPLTFPHRNEDNPAFLNFKSERGRVLYGEDVYVGYRYYETCQKDVLFPFGHGLSYTTFSMSNLTARLGDDSKNLLVILDVTNTGPVDGAEVVQVYVRQRAPSVKRPSKELKGFAKPFIPHGETRQVSLTLNVKYAASFWDESRHAWIIEHGQYDVLVGNSSANVPLQASFSVADTTWWNGV